MRLGVCLSGDDEPLLVFSTAVRRARPGDELAGGGGDGERERVLPPFFDLDFELLCERGDAVLCERGDAVLCERGDAVLCDRGDAVFCDRGDAVFCERGDAEVLPRLGESRGLDFCFFPSTRGDTTLFVSSDRCDVVLRSERAAIVDNVSERGCKLRPSSTHLLMLLQAVQLDHLCCSLNSS